MFSNATESLKGFCNRFKSKYVGKIYRSAAQLQYQSSDWIQKEQSSDEIQKVKKPERIQKEQSSERTQKDQKPHRIQKEQNSDGIQRGQSSQTLPCSGPAADRHHYSAKRINRNQHLFPLLITVLSLLLPVQALTETLNPPSRPFMFMLKAPTELCSTHFNIKIDDSYFHIVSSTLNSRMDQSISQFNTDSFGHIPYMDEHTKEMYKGGLPQLVDMGKHLKLAEADIKKHFTVDQQGLAVLSFDEWRPQWDRNWEPKDFYRHLSINNTMEQQEYLSEIEAEDVTRMRYEIEAKRIFVQSIRIGKRLQPIRLWGFYRYPECYNYDYKDDIVNYNGVCKDIEKSRNDELWWLWKESTALFPTIYLDLELRDTKQGRLFVRHQIQETMRVSTSNSSYFIPVYPFVNGVYKKHTNEYLTELDLVNTIGEAAALGAAGVVHYMHFNDMEITKSQNTCIGIQQHMEKVMNPYMLNVSMATQLCSERLCRSQGRCVRKQWDEGVFLHLDPRSYQIQQQGPGTRLTVSGNLSQEDINWFDIHFDCICYNTQEPCRIVDRPTNRGAQRSDLMLVMIPLFLISAVL